MRTESRPKSDYTRTWSPSGEIEYTKLGDGPRLRYLKAGSGPTALILLHTVRTQLDHFQLVIPKIAHAFTIYAIDMPGMGWSDITPGASYTEPALRRAIVRSEEHTSELQSRLHLVCRLLLEKKNTRRPPTLTSLL